MLRMLLLLTLVGCARLDQVPLLVSLFGPPEVTAAEAYEAEGARFDHAAFDSLLRRHVRDGLVDYDGLATERPALDAYVQTLATADYDALGRDEKLAFAINAYNAFTLVLILDHLPLASIKDIPADQRWDAVRWSFAGRTVSLTWLEHEELRARFVEPRIHFAINCASIGCPPLRSEAYTAAHLASQLEAQAKQMHTDPRWLRIEGTTLHLTSLYLWYADDFTTGGRSIPAAAAQWRGELAQGEWTVKWLDYDWALNRTPPGITPRP